MHASAFSCPPWRSLLISPSSFLSPWVSSEFSLPFYINRGPVAYLLINFHAIAWVTSTVALCWWLTNTTAQKVHWLPEFLPESCEESVNSSPQFADEEEEVQRVTEIT